MKTFLLKIVYFLFGIFSLIFLSCSSKSEKANTEKPNILILFADDLGYEKLSCYGGLDIQTANIDEYANPDGIPFTNVLFNRGKSKREWVSGGINDDFCVFDGKWRLHKKNNKLIDCRQLPHETEADMNEKEAQQAQEKLLPVIEELKNL